MVLLRLVAARRALVALASFVLLSTLALAALRLSELRRTGGGRSGVRAEVGRRRGQPAATLGPGAQPGGHGEGLGAARGADLERGHHGARAGDADQADGRRPVGPGGRWPPSRRRRRTSPARSAGLLVNQRGLPEGGSQGQRAVPRSAGAARRHREPQSCVRARTYNASRRHLQHRAGEDPRRGGEQGDRLPVQAAPVLQRQPRVAGRPEGPPSDAPGAPAGAAAGSGTERARADALASSRPALAAFTPPPLDQPIVRPVGEDPGGRCAEARSGAAQRVADRGHGRAHRAVARRRIDRRRRLRHGQGVEAGRGGQGQRRPSSSSPPTSRKMRLEVGKGLEGDLPRPRGQRHPPAEGRPGLEERRLHAGGRRRHRRRVRRAPRRAQRHGAPPSLRRERARRRQTGQPASSVAGIFVVVFLLVVITPPSAVDGAATRATTAARPSRAPSASASARRSSAAATGAEVEVAVTPGEAAIQAPAASEAEVTSEGGGSSDSF